MYPQIFSSQTDLIGLISTFACVLCRKCSKNILPEITKRIKDMGEIFCKKYVQSSDEHTGSHIDFARKRLQLGETLYYKTLESILLEETQRLSQKNQSYDCLVSDRKREHFENVTFQVLMQCFCFFFRESCSKTSSTAHCSLAVSRSSSSRTTRSGE